MKRKRFLYGLTLVVVAGGIAYWRLTLPPAPPDDEGDSTASTAGLPREQSENEKTRRSLFGVWQDEYQGKRTMTLNDDGTGTMLVELGGLQAVLFASKLRFDMKWSFDGQKLTKRTVGGEPADKVNLILNTMGNTAEDTILEMTEDRLLLLDKNGKTRYDWQRVKKDHTSKQ